MSFLEIHEIGEVIRKVRKDRGLRLEDLADENISPATISNIERGVPHVNLEKTKYLLNKLELDIESLPSLMVSEQQEMEETKFELFKVEVLLDIEDLNPSQKKLENLDLDDGHPYAATAHFLKGKLNRIKRNWKRAERSFFNAIRLANQNNPDSESNIEAASYNELSLTSFGQNDLKQALKYAENGLEVFQPGGERPQYEFILKRNRAIYLERLGRLGEAMQIVQEAWPQIHEMIQVETILSFYWLRSDLLRRSQMFDEAITYAKEGLEFARINRNHDSMFDLWTVLGSIYMDKKRWDQAESSFEMALKLSDQVQEEDKLTTVHARLGVLYMHRPDGRDPFETIQKAIQIGERTNSATRLSYALQVMGDYFRKKEDLEQAILYYTRMLKLAKRHDYKKKEYLALFRLSQCYETQDEEKFHQCLRELYQVQQELQEEAGGFQEEMD
ncbi:tetratricopeptide (TPR) repeat protein [Kroppenstedtia sanguinis]|uniref:helix-turn-helix domain-containing protein n=1 Tax=Kroppenstedtia sanguinis TaxID=1380684 RepID=UPI003D1AC632